jgi:DNA invertase Pin-like site-specific DNA recombinase
MCEQLRHIGYVHISPTDLHPNMQIDALKRVKCSHIHRSTISGILSVQEALQELLHGLSAGDQLVVYRLDRIARDEYALADFRDQLEAMGVTMVVASDMPDETGGGL